MEYKLTTAHVKNKAAALRAVVVERNVLIVLLVGVDGLRLEERSATAGKSNRFSVTMREPPGARSIRPSGAAYITPPIRLTMLLFRHTGLLDVGLYD